jgi:hypothetical protein
MNTCFRRGARSPRRKADSGLFVRHVINLVMVIWINEKEQPM